MVPENDKKKHFNKPVRMTKKDHQDFEEADKCHICNKKYSEKDIRIRGLSYNWKIRRICLSRL